LYTPSSRPYCGLEELEYPAHDWTAVVTTCGRICYQRRKINVSQVFAGQKVGVKQVDEHIWLVTFMHYDLGYFDDETCRLEAIENPFGPKLLPMSPIAASGLPSGVKNRTTPSHTFRKSAKTSSAVTP
jgi:putative transposase